MKLTKEDRTAIVEEIALGACGIAAAFGFLTWGLSNFPLGVGVWLFVWFGLIIWFVFKEEEKRKNE